MLLTTTAISAQALAARLRSGGMGEAGLKSGLATEDELEEMATAWEEWAGRDDASLAMLHGEILIQK